MIGSLALSPLFFFFFSFSRLNGYADSAAGWVRWLRDSWVVDKRIGRMGCLGRGAVVGRSASLGLGWLVVWSGALVIGVLAVDDLQRKRQRWEKEEGTKKERKKGLDEESRS